MISAPDRIEWQPLPKQADFLTRYRGVDELLYGGAAGGAKSEALLIFSFLRRQQYPQSKGLLLRRTYTELMMGGGLVPRSHELFHGIGHWQGDQKTWTFQNGSFIQFGHMVHEDSWTLYYGSAWEDIGFDELTHFSLHQYLMVGMGRARTTIPDCKPKIRCTTNPGGTGHLWVRERFVEPLRPMQIGWFIQKGGVDVKVPRSQVEATPLAKSRAFLPARLEDNPYLHATGDYEAGLAALPDDDYRALRLGDWYAWSGSVFKRFSKETHVIEPRQLADDCPRWTGLDWGYASPFVCLWLAAGRRLPSDPEPLKPCDKVHVYVYRELTLKQKLDEEQRDACLAVMAPDERILHWNADPASFFQRNNRTGMTPADWWAKRGVLLEPSNNDRILGKRAVDSYLDACACGIPILRFFSTCTETIRTIPSLGYSQIHPEDVDKSDIDHHYDSVRYALMGVVPQIGVTSGHGLERTLIGRYA